MFIDITPGLDSGSGVFPGDTAFASEWRWQMASGAPVNVSAVRLSVHTGAHADAPLHYDAAGVAIDAMPVERYVGPCRVVDACGSGAFVEADVLGRLVGDRPPPRVLVRTYDVLPHGWDGAFTALRPEAVEMLAARGVFLIGVDAASIDPAESKTLAAHDAVRRCGMCILEGLDLREAPAGDYELIALPLKLRGLDASPVRAVLRR